VIEFPSLRFSAGDMMNKKAQGIHIVAILGSVRPDNNTSKVLALVVDEIKKHPDVTLEIIDPNELDLPLPGKDEKSSAERLKKTVSSASGLILSTPEYNGSYSSVIKLIIEHLGEPSALLGKPVVLLGVASGSIGAVKALEHLASVCLNEGAIVLPGVVSVARVHKIFPAPGQCQDKGLEKLIRGLADTLLNYVRQQNH